jgi:hypothetical protein
MRCVCCVSTTNPERVIISISGEREEFYQFVSLDQLAEDFWAAVGRWEVV